MRPASSRPAGSVHLIRVLVTGATGYIGGRLTPRPLEEGYRVRVLAPQRGTGALTFFSG